MGYAEIFCTYHFRVLIGFTHTHIIKKKDVSSLTHTFEMQTLLTTVAVLGFWNMIRGQYVNILKYSEILE